MCQLFDIDSGCVQTQTDHPCVRDCMPVKVLAYGQWIEGFQVYITQDKN